MSIRPLKVINPGRKKAKSAPAKRAPRKAANPPRAKVRYRNNPPSRNWMDDFIGSASAMGGGLAMSYVSEKVSSTMPAGAGAKYTPVGLALVLTGAMGLTARKNMILRSFFLGGIGALASDQAKKLGYVDQVQAVEGVSGMGRMSSSQRIASILGTGPGRSRMNDMGFLSPGSPRIRQTAASMGYLTPGGPYVNQSETSVVDVY